MSKYYIMVEGSNEKWMVEDVTTDHQLGGYLLQKMMYSRDCLYTKEGIQKFVDKVLSNDSNKGLYPTKEEGIKDIATFITGVFKVFKTLDNESIGSRRKKHLKYIMEKTLRCSALHNQEILQTA